MRPGSFPVLLVFLIASVASSGSEAANKKTRSTSAGSSYLLVWAGDERHEQPDFLAVLDADPASRNYGHIVRRVPVSGSGMMPHHTEYEFPESGMLFANGWAAGHTFVIDAHDPASAHVKTDFVQADGYGFPHSFARLPNGHVLATFQSHSRGYAPPGGLVELDDSGKVVRSASAVTPDLKEEETWPYSLAVAAALDRVVVSNTPMGMPAWAKPPAGSWPSEKIDAVVTNQVQVWRLSDLKLLSTLALPPSGTGAHDQFPAEPRLLPDGSVYVNTFSCGLYRVTGVAEAKPRVDFIRVFPGSGKSMGEMCGVPVVVGHYWIQTVGALPGLIALDITDPAKPVEVSRLVLDHAFHMPHWLAADRKGNRLVVTGANQTWLLIVNLDPKTGKMAVDERFGDPRANTPYVRFAASDAAGSGPAQVHGALFAPR